VTRLRLIATITTRMARGTPNSKPRNTYGELSQLSLNTATNVWSLFIVIVIGLLVEFVVPSIIQRSKFPVALMVNCVPTGNVAFD
jgi:hypothetical protein